MFQVRIHVQEADHTKEVNPLPTSDAHVASWTLYKPITMYFRIGIILVSAF